MSELAYPKPTGPFAVGFADGEVVDRVYPRSRPDEGDARRLPLRVWYPAQARADRAWRGDVEVFRAYGNDALVPAAWMERLAGASASGMQGAAPASGHWPILVFSHGARGYVDQSMALMEELASHGYVALSFGHPGGACALRYLDGRIDFMDAAFLAALSEIFPPMIAAFADAPDARLAFARSESVTGEAGRHNTRWADDFRAVLDALHQGTVEGPAATVIPSGDLRRVAAGGFSFSGPAATLVAHQDARLLAGINIDGGDFRPELLDTQVRCPTLALASDQPKILSLLVGMELRLVDFHELSYEPLETIGTREDVHRFVIDGPAHHEFTDVVLVPAAQRAVLPGAGRVDGDFAIPRVNGVVRGFLDRYLRGSGSFPREQLDAFSGVRKVDLAPIREWAREART